MKEIRNIIIHNGGKVTNSFSLKHPDVSTENGCIQIYEDYYIKSKLKYKKQKSFKKKNMYRLYIYIECLIIMSL